jgi:DnaJ-class molecular chaperone
MRQYKNAQYEESVATLQSINPDALNDADKKALYDTLGKADSAAAQRKSARAEFELGQDALKNNRPGEANQHFYNVVNNKFADAGTAQKAREQMGVADQQRKAMTGDLKTVYTSAVADYKAGNLGTARQKFTQPSGGAGYKPAMFHAARMIISRTSPSACRRPEARRQWTNGSGAPR